MRKILLGILIVAFAIFIVGFGLRFSKNIIVSDTGLWISLVGSFLILLVNIFICIDSYKKKNRQKDNSDLAKSDDEISDQDSNK